MNKKILIITGIIIGIVIIGLAIYFLWPSQSAQPGEQGFFSYLFPSSKERGDLSLFEQPIASIRPKSSETESAQPAGKLTQLTQIPVSGAVFNKNTGKINYFEQSTGHLYEISPRGGEKKQISITTIPKVFETVWSNDLSKAALKYIDPETDSLRTFLVSSPTTSTTTTTNQLEGSFLPLNLSAIVMSPSQEKIFYLLKNNGVTGVTASLENKNQKEIFSSPFENFLIKWPQKDIITIQTKPSASIEGYFYSLNPQTGDFSKIIGGIKGLTALYSSVGNKVIYSQSEKNGFSAKIYDAKEKTFSDFSYKVLPEKCFFSPTKENLIYCAAPKSIPGGNYPNDWYKGLISFEDSLWAIDLANGSTKIIMDKDGFDAINLFTDDSENYLLFQNKKDGALWSLQLN
ncbi:hypothetical protein KKB69_01915 [Patescibacteria group bacterium]|nr:hypothetical protein [Patescibacteria group bacterium]